MVRPPLQHVECLKRADGPLDRGVINQNVNTREIYSDLLDHRFHLLAVRDIKLVACGAPRSLRDLLAELLRFHRAIGNRKVGSFSVEAPTNRDTGRTRCTRDHTSPARQFHQVTIQPENSGAFPAP